MKKLKILSAILSALVLVCVSVLGTVAFFTDREAVVNTFTVGQVEISLDETKVTPDGLAVAGADRVTENQYHLIPGQTYIKDPTLTVKAGSEESYLRLLVTLSHAKELKEIFGTDFLPQNYVSGWDSALWVSTETVLEDTAANTVTYEFRYFEPVKAVGGDLALDPLFDTITVPGTVTGEHLALLADDPDTAENEGFTIKVVGHAIQKATFDTADAAWDAFTQQWGTQQP